MCNVSYVMGKGVYELFTARFIGKVSGAYCSAKCDKLTHFTTDGGDCFTPNDIFSVGDDGVVVSRTSSPEVDSVICPLGLSVLSVSGKALGEVTDIEVNKRTITGVIVSGVSYAPSTIVSRSDELIMLNDTGKRIVKKVDKSHAVAQSTEQAAVVNGNSNMLPPRLRQEQYSSYDFLLGKVAVKPLALASGEPLISEGETVTREIIDVARSENKLIQLALVVS